MMASAVTLLLALTWGGTRYAWLSQQIFVLLVAAARSDGSVYLVGAAGAGTISCRSRCSVIG